MTRFWSTAIVLAALAGLAGCRNWPPRRDEISLLPPALPPAPSLGQVVSVVNNNTARIESFHTQQATISGAGFPTLRASLAFQRPLNLRLQADMPMGIGQAVDLGSNNEVFWFWVQGNEPPAIYYCRHGQFASSPMRRSLPLDPYWLIECLGLVTLDPSATQGPIARPDGTLQVQSVTQTEQGPITKVTILEGRQGLVLAQYLYDPRGRLTASTIAGKYQRDPLSGLFMPSVVEIRTEQTAYMPTFSLRIDLANVQINRPIPNAQSLWQMPVIGNTQAIDLCGPGLALPPSIPSGSPSVPAGYVPPGQPATSTRPRPGPGYLPGPR